MLREKLLKGKDTFRHDGQLYDLKALKTLAKDLPAQDYPVADLVWVLAHRRVDSHRRRKANMDKPLFVALDTKGRPTVVDGAHRLTNATEWGWTTIQGKAIRPELLETVRLS